MKTVFAFILIFFLASCGNNQSVERNSNTKHSWGEMKGLEKVVGNMNDTSYSTVRSRPPRLNALKKAVKIDHYEGKYLWAEYAATWCKTCSRQAPQAKQAELSLAGQDIQFITVMTGKGTSYGDHATVETAQFWASQYDLDPQHVFAADLWFKTIPEHRFFSPQGHTLFVHVGYLSKQEILQKIQYYKNAWDEYQQSGTYSAD